MAGEQYLAMYEEDERGVAPAVPVMRFLPVTSNPQPKFNPKDEPRKEFRGVNTRLGDASVVRRESSYSHPLDFGYYPGVEVGLILKHIFGFAGIRAIVDVSAKRGILYPSPGFPYGAGAALGTKAVAMIPNLEEGGVTKSQLYAGERFKSLTIAIKGSDDVKVSVEGMGAGPWIGPADQAATPGVSWPAADPFISALAQYYIGAGAARTGTAPDFTDIGPGTMQQFLADEMTIKITPGWDDKIVGNGIKGPSKTYVANQFAVEVDCTVDYEDPASGFSSADEYKAQFSGPRTNSLMIVLTGEQLAGAATEKYKTVIDMPLVQAIFETPDRNSEGKTPPMKMKFKTLINAAIGYPIAMMTTDQAAAY